MFGYIPADITHFVGREAELAALKAFHRGATTGLFVLYGFGGCGKSATLKRFIESQGFFDPSRKQNAFLWSFSHDPSLEHFFAALRDYVQPMLARPDRQAIAADTFSYLDLPDLIERSAKQINLFLDAIEIVSVADHTERDGSLAVPALRVLLQRVGETGSGEMKIYCTTRVVPPELPNAVQVAGRAGYGDDTSGLTTVLDLTVFSDADGVNLLRAKRVRGRRETLEQLCQQLRNHAYSISLMADLLRRVFRGDVREAAGVLEASADLANPLLEILHWYETRLDPDELAVLQGASLFRNGVTGSDLAVLLRHLQRTSIPTSQLAAMTDIEISAAGLVDAGLLFEEDEPSAGETIVLLHPVVREYFYRQITDPAGLHREAYEIVAARTPESADITSAGEFNLLKELIFQALGAGDVALAWRIYAERIGGYPAIGYGAADHPSGTELVEMFLHVGSRLHVLPAAAIYDLYTDGALYLTNEGRPAAAVTLLNSFRITDSDAQAERGVSLTLVRAGIELLRGETRSSDATVSLAEEMFSIATGPFTEVDRLRLTKEIMSRRAAARFAFGEGAINGFVEAAAAPFVHGTVPHDYGPVRHIWALTLTGDIDGADRLADAAISYPLEIGANMLVQRVAAMAAINASWGRRPDHAARWRSMIAPWGIRADIHVAILTLLAAAVSAFTTARYEEADVMLSRGARFAGDNGFLLEWLDAMALRSVTAVHRGDLRLAMSYSRAVVEGDTRSYLTPLKGARHPTVEYVWALATAQAVLRALTPPDTYLPPVRTELDLRVEQVTSSRNPLYAAAIDAIS